jgi:hypothetical protein
MSILKNPSRIHLRNCRYILLLIITNSILTSCVKFTSVTITNRHYRNGFNLEYVLRTHAKNKLQDETMAVANLEFDRKCEAIEERGFPFKESTFEEVAAPNEQGTIAPKNVSLPNQFVFLSKKSVGDSTKISADPNTISTIKKNSISTKTKKGLAAWALISVLFVLFFFLFISGTC